MCNFVPGECLAFGEGHFLLKEMPKDIPGRVQYVPLRHTELPSQGESRFEKFGFLHVTDIPRGLEIEVVSRLSAAFPAQVRQGGIAVELNYYLPTAIRSLSGRGDLELTEPARAWARAILSTTQWPTDQALPPVAFIDSGINPAQFGARAVTAFDFSNGASGQPAGGNHDENGHGTRVGRILHESLHPDVPLISAKIADEDEQVTVLALCRTFAEIVARYSPAVVNVSLAPLDDAVQCPDGENVRVPAFHSGILCRVFGLGDRSFVVMAAGNEGQECNQRHVDDLVQNVVYAVALNSRLTKTRYSASPSGGGGGDLATYAFGGDDEEDGTGLGVFRGESRSFGTSFAAPFVAASAYAAAVRCARRSESMHRWNVLGQDHYQSGGWYPSFVGRPWADRPQWWR